VRPPFSPGRRLHAKTHVHTLVHAVAAHQLALEARGLPDRRTSPSTQPDSHYMSWYFFYRLLVRSTLCKDCSQFGAIFKLPFGIPTTSQHA